MSWTIGTRAMRARLSEAQNHRCCHCGLRMDDDPTAPHGVTIEHVLPRRLGGSNDWSNLAAAGRRCNERYGTGAASGCWQFGPEGPRFVSYDPMEAAHA